jgi:threonine dehydrogenase-like Zn-dependent dehydrogenase
LYFPGNGLTKLPHKHNKESSYRVMGENKMKAITINSVAAGQLLGALRYRRIRGRSEHPQELRIGYGDAVDPLLLNQHWVKIRTIMSGISDLEERLILDGEASFMGEAIRFPFIPGSENFGIVAEIGEEVKGLEIGTRVVVDPLLGCRAREIKPLCPSCSRGRPSHCRNLASNESLSGPMIGCCPETGGGWADFFVAHQSQVHIPPDSADGEHCVMVPILARAFSAVLRAAPDPGDKVVVVGASALGLAVMAALRELSARARILVVAEHPFQIQSALKISDAEVVEATPRGSCYEKVAEFSGSSYHSSKSGKYWLCGGADLVYETTGKAPMAELAFRFAGECKRVALLTPLSSQGFDLSPIAWKGLQVVPTGFWGRESFDGKTVNTFETALGFIGKRPFPLSDLVTHRYTLKEYREAFSVISNRSRTSAGKVIFSHVI